MCFVCAYVYVFYDFILFFLRGVLSSLYVNMCACHMYFYKFT